MTLSQWPEPINTRRQRKRIMPKLMRSKVVELMEAVGFSTASALSTGRLTNKINRLDRAVPKDLDLERDDLNELLDFVMDCIGEDHKIVVEEDRPNIPAVEQAKAAQQEKRARTKPFDRSASKASKYDWGKILSGDIVVLEQGTDYDCKSEGLAMRIRTEAKKLGMKVKIKVDGGRVIAQAVK